MQTPFKSDLAQTDARVYERQNSVVFKVTRERWGGLSNMAPGFPILINGWNIRTSEALYQSCRFPHMPRLQQLIISEASPMTAKMRTKPYRNVSRPDWEKVRVLIMKWCLRVKLLQNWNSFSALLLSTGDKPIVEDSKKDPFWSAQPQVNGTLVGRNVMGRLLMELREELRHAPERLQVVNPLNIERFTLINEEIGVVTRRFFPPQNHLGETGVTDSNELPLFSK
jgi:ribA/ribD-fused uncharacterized protein